MWALYELNCRDLYDYEFGHLYDYDCRSYMARNIAVDYDCRDLYDYECRRRRRICGRIFECPDFSGKRGNPECPAMCGQKFRMSKYVWEKVETAVWGPKTGLLRFLFGQH